MTVGFVKVSIKGEGDDASASLYGLRVKSAVAAGFAKVTVRQKSTAALAKMQMHRLQVHLGQSNH